MEIMLLSPLQQEYIPGGYWKLRVSQAVESATARNNHQFAKIMRVLHLGQIMRVGRRMRRIGPYPPHRQRES